MTDEERQRQMDFIVSTLASVSAKLYTLTEKVTELVGAQSYAELGRKTEALRTARLEDAFVAVSKLSERMAKHLGDHHSRVTNIEEAIVVLKGLLDRMSNGTGES